jgi:hypothetical protein
LYLHAGYLRLRAALTEGGEPVDSCFAVYTAERDKLGNRRKINDGCGAFSQFLLPAGRYYVWARAGDATVDTELAVLANQLTDQAVNLNAGYLRLRAVLSDGGEQVEGCFAVYTATRDIQGNHTKINDGCGPSGQFILPVRRYYVQARAGDAATDAELEVVANDLTEHTLNLQAGYLRLEAMLAEGGKPVESCFAVYQAQPDKLGNRRKINDGCGAFSQFLLPTGRYYVQAQTGDAATDTELEVPANRLTSHALNLNAGYLRLSAVLTKGGNPVESCFAVYVFELDMLGNRKKVTGGCGTSSQFTLPAGKYFIQVTRGEITSPVVYEVQAGAQMQQQVVLDVR